MSEKKVLCTTCGKAPGFEKQMGGMGGSVFPMSGDGSVYWRLVCDCPHKQNIEFLRSQFFAQGEWESENYKMEKVAPIHEK